MKSLKEFIAENLEKPTVTTTQKNSELSENNQDYNNKDTNENNENILKGKPNNEKTE